MRDQTIHGRLLDVAPCDAVRDELPGERFRWEVRAEVLTMKQIDVDIPAEVQLFRFRLRHGSVFPFADGPCLLLGGRLATGALLVEGLMAVVLQLFGGHALEALSGSALLATTDLGEHSMPLLFT